MNSSMSQQTLQYDENKDYYKTLGVSVGADIRTITKAYRQLALLYHPDRNRTTIALQRTQDLMEAFGTLSQHKEQYDRARDGAVRKLNHGGISSDRGVTKM